MLKGAFIFATGASCGLAVGVMLGSFIVLNPRIAAAITESIEKVAPNKDAEKNLVKPYEAPASETAV